MHLFLNITTISEPPTYFPWHITVYTPFPSQKLARNGFEVTNNKTLPVCCDMNLQSHLAGRSKKQ